MDTLHIEGLRADTRIGVYPWEQRINQRLLISITITKDFSNYADDLAHAVDYEALCKSVTHFVESRAFQLIETVAEQVAQLIKTDFNLLAVTVSVSKPHAIKNAGEVKVTVTR